jgi:hypothetical protein
VFRAWLLGPPGPAAVPLTILVKDLLVDSDPRAGWADALLRTTGEMPDQEPRARRRSRAGRASSSEAPGRHDLNLDFSPRP